MDLRLEIVLWAFLDHLSKLIEEIFSARFVKETTVLRANLSKGEATNRENTQRYKNPTFPQFVYEFLKEKSSKNLEQVLLDFFLFNLSFLKETFAIIYSTFVYKRKSSEVEIFSRFLSEEIDNEDLTFFLFVRSLLEKELVVVLANSKKCYYWFS